MLPSSPDPSRKTLPSPNVSPKRVFRILFVDDSPDDVALLVHHLEEKGYRLSWDQVDTQRALSEALDDEWDALLIDYNLPDFDPFEALNQARAVDPILPAILVSGAIEEAEALAALRAGVDDYVLKDRPARLGSAIEQALEKRRLIQERGRAQRALRESLRRYRHISELSSDFAYEYRLEKRGSLKLMWVTEAFASITGYTPRQAIARGGWRALVHKLDTDVIRTHIRTLVGGEASQNEFRIVTRQGDVRWVVDASLPIEDPESGKVVRIVGAVRDITDRKDAEREREHLAAVVNSANLGIVSMTSEGTVLSWNPAAENIYGLTAETMLGQSIFRLCPPDQPSRMAEALKHLEQMPHTLGGVYRHLRHDGTLVDVQVTLSPVRDVVGQVIAASAIIQDVTEQQKVQDRASRLAEAVRRSTNSIIISDPRGRIEWVNEGFTRMTGYTLDEVAGKTPGQVLQRPDTSEKARTYLRHRLNEGKGFKAELKNYRKDGSSFWVRSDVEPLHNDQGHLSGFMGIVTDITEHKIRERELQAAKESAERMTRLKSILLTNLSHEIRTPLNGMMGFSQILEESLEGEYADFAGIIVKSGKRLVNTLDAVLNLSRLENDAETVHPTSFNLYSLAEEVVELFSGDATSRGLQLTLDASGRSEWMVRADKTATYRILSNLVSNAVKYTEQGGVVVALRSRGQDVFVRVVDTGVGIGEAFLPRLFEGFAQESSGISRDYEGLGIGLTITKHLVDLMEGRIAVKSEKGKGSTFTVQWKNVLERADYDPSPDVAEGPVTVGRKRILALEDNEVNRLLIARHLEEGYEVETVGTIEEALEQARAKHFDAFLVDINLSERRTGIEVLNTLREWPSYAKTPIIACTAYALPQDEERFMNVGFTAYLSKPFTLKGLTSVLDQAFRAEVDPGQAFAPLPSLALELPPPPKTLLEVIRMRQASTQPDPDRLVELLDQDPVTASWMLRHVNSSYYGLNQKVSNIERVVRLLGFNPICELILSGALSHTFTSVDMPEAQPIYEYLMRSSMATGAYAGELAYALGVDRAAVVFTGGLMHQVGRLALLSMDPDVYVSLWDNPDTSCPDPPPRGQEILRMSTDYISLGGNLVKSWGLSPALQGMIWHHPNPACAPRSVQHGAWLVWAAQAASRRVCEGETDIGLALGYDPEDARRLQAFARAVGQPVGKVYKAIEEGGQRVMRLLETLPRP